MNPEKEQSSMLQTTSYPSHYMKQTADNENLEHHLITEPCFKGPEHHLPEK